ncbi:MAG: hypothetical protein K6L60_07930 [Oceanobacter sp.]
MTAVIHHGPPGSYKTFALIQRVIIPALQKGRTVCHNIRGLNSVERIASAMGIELPPEAKLIAVEHDSQAGFEHMARFFQWAPMGALIVMDEGQRVYPTRLRNLGEFDTPSDERETLDSGIQRPSNVENAFDQHRHMNWDIYISTTNVAKIHKEVRAVVEYGFRHRDMAGVLPWYKNKWREFKHDAESSGKAVSHYIGAPVIYTADPKVFECYQSTATGTAKGSSENKSIFADPKLRVFLAITVLCVGYFIYSIAQMLERYEVGTEETAPGIVAPPHVPVHVSAHQPAAKNPAVQRPGLAPGLRYLRRFNPAITSFSQHTFPQSERWRLAGVFDGTKGVALISDGHQTITLNLNQSCAYTLNQEWLCWFENAMVATHTGPLPSSDPDITTDLQPISAQL